MFSPFASETAFSADASAGFSFPRASCASPSTTSFAAAESASFDARSAAIPFSRMGTASDGFPAASAMSASPIAASEAPRASSAASFPHVSRASSGFPAASCESASPTQARWNFGFRSRTACCSFAAASKSPAYMAKSPTLFRCGTAFG